VSRCDLQQRRGLTLIELLLSLAGTALVALGVVTMLGAVAYGTDSRRDMYAVVAQSKASTARLTAVVRGARQVLARNDDALVLWVGDDNNDGLPALHEIRRLAIDREAGELTAFTADPAAAPIVYALDADFERITAELSETAAMPGELWAGDVTDWSITLDAADPADATLVGIRLSLRQDTITEVAVAAAALRNGR
jgi:hypothetical protein